MNVSDFMKSNGLIHDMDQELLDLTLESFGGLTDNQVALILPNNKVSGWLLLNEIKAFLEECRDADTESEHESESDPDSNINTACNYQIDNISPYPYSSFCSFGPLLVGKGKLVGNNRPAVQKPRVVNDAGGKAAA